MKRLPSVRLLLGFEAAARHGNYSRAADELCLSQSAISHQIAQLEEQLGQTLFRRTGRGVELTMAGKALLSNVQRSLDMMRNGLERISAYLEPGLVVIVCPAPIAHGWLLPLLPKLRKTFPELCLLVSTDESARYIDEMDVDITIGYRPLQQADVLETEFLSDEWLAVSSYTKAKPASAMALFCLEQDLLNEQKGRYITEHFAATSKRAIFDDPRLLLTAVQQEPSVGLISRRTAQADLAAGRLHVMAELPALVQSPLWLSRRQGETRTPLIAQLYQHLLDEALSTEVRV
jgi:DNA-binding transcriptional LysR family regulator